MAPEKHPAVVSRPTMTAASPMRRASCNIFSARPCIRWPRISPPGSAIGEAGARATRSITAATRVAVRAAREAHPQPDGDRRFAAGEAARHLSILPALCRELAAALGAWQSGTVIKAHGRLSPRLLAGQGPERHGHAGAICRGLFACDASRDAGHPAGRLHRRSAGAALGRARRSRPAREVLARLVTALRRRGRRIHRHRCGRATGPDDAWSGGGYSDLIVDLDAQRCGSAADRAAARRW